MSNRQQSLYRIDRSNLTLLAENDGYENTPLDSSEKKQIATKGKGWLTRFFNWF